MFPKVYPRMVVATSRHATASKKSVPTPNVAMAVRVALGEYSVVRKRSERPTFGWLFVSSAKNSRVSSRIVCFLAGAAPFEHGATEPRGEEKGESFGDVLVRDLAHIPGNQVDKDEKARKLEALIAEISKTCLRETWTTADDLRGRVSLALLKRIEDNEAEGTARPGWYRGTQLPRPTEEPRDP